MAWVVFTGQHNDARMNLAIALTAVRHGASVANHMEVLSLLKKKGKMKIMPIPMLGDREI